MTNPLAGLFRARQKEAARPALFARSTRLCGEYLAAQGATPAPARLTQAIGAFAVSLETPSADPFDALLQVGERALEAGGDGALRLALGVAETATLIRQRSKGAWRLHGLALDGLGRGEEALESYERHLSLRQNGAGAPEIARRVDTLRRRKACLDAAIALSPGADSPLHGLHGRPTASAAPEFAAHVRARVAEHGIADPGVRRLLKAYSTYRRLVERTGTPDPLLGGSTPIGVSGLRRLVAGRTVCLVSHGGNAAGNTAGNGLGAEIDGYDLVVRCDSFRIRAEDTGERTDLHAVSLRGETPWNGPVWTEPAGIRLVFGDPAAGWRRATRQRLVPGAQEHIGDASLRRPLTDPALLGEDSWETATTTAFTVLRLLDFLDVSPRLDLIGFGLPGRLRPREAEWVMDRATRVDDSKMRIALR
ncbi:hypothetical protein DIZ27_09095 [Streptomyces sp. NWU339]|uniref:glycosyltransferase family 29 protein n=1 Tax=Streptomyces sp. NWU339 TaxID=2185284 RepID=UPI000D676BC4|nr:glycosyltransferase family 29 protein [Streptomyces sp. NWU339]PWI11004.1 hypothetical protein DIZ27_09095 [Streptomyces sp. NWU339]